VTERINHLLRALARGSDAIYDEGYSWCKRCPVCHRAVAEADCDRELDQPTHMRMCFAQVDGNDPTCIEGLRALPD
jgi:hypothetical protein